MFAAIAAVALAIGIVNAFSGAQDAAWRGGSYDIGRRLFWEMSSIAVILLLLPILVLAVRRMRRTPGLALQAAIAAIALLGFSTLHITGMVWVRKLVLWLAGGAYDFRFSLATVLYEFRKDAVAVVLIAATIWLLESRRELKRAAAALSAPPAPPQPLSPDLIWLRDGTSRIRVVPREILWVASAGNYIEYSLANGTQHLIRGTLAATLSSVYGIYNGFELLEHEPSQRDAWLQKMLRQVADVISTDELRHEALLRLQKDAARLQQQVQAAQQASQTRHELPVAAPVDHRRPDRRRPKLAARVRCEHDLLRFPLRSRVERRLGQ